MRYVFFFAFGRRYGDFRMALVYCAAAIRNRIDAFIVLQNGDIPNVSDG